jgi:hypothetical protein
MFVLTKNYSNRWQAQASYVWSETTGSIANNGTGGVTGSQFLTPSLALVNTDGPLDNDRTHEFKLFAGYQIPIVEVNLSGYFRSLTGRTYTPNIVVSGTPLNYPGSITALIESRGSRRYPTQQTVDLRIEKTFNIDVHRFGLFVDIANALNNDTVLGRQTRFPNRSIVGNTVLFDSPTSIEAPRQITIGGRWTF